MPSHTLQLLDRLRWPPSLKLPCPIGLAHALRSLAHRVVDTYWCLQTLHSGPWQVCLWGLYPTAQIFYRSRLESWTPQVSATICFLKSYTHTTHTPIVLQRNLFWDLYLKHNISISDSLTESPGSPVLWNDQPPPEPPPTTPGSKPGFSLPRLDTLGLSIMQLLSESSFNLDIVLKTNAIASCLVSVSQQMWYLQWHLQSYLPGSPESLSWLLL